MQGMILRCNQSTGNIPPQLCSLPSLRLLDLSQNKLFWFYSSLCLQHCSHRWFKKNELSLSVQSRLVLDLERPRGGVSRDLAVKKSWPFNEQPVRRNRTRNFGLTQLGSLNLSRNHLMGKIPSNIDSMKNLESLDLSYNNLSGEIPAAISDLSFLSFLILSYDDLIGQIPLGIQVETLDAWSYAGNPKLYGRPLTKHFSKDVNPDEAKHGGANGSQNELLYLGIGVGYIVGLNGFWYSLILNRAWRHKYFRILDHILDWLYLFVALKLNKVG